MHAWLQARWVSLDRGFLRILSQEVVMILMVAAVLVVLWLLGFLAFHITAFAIHLLLIAAVIAVIAHFTVGRRSGRTRV
jgi:DMSO reductase anchor subunit